jgi:hypothetical protein
MLANRTASTLHQQAWSQRNSRHHISPLVRPATCCAATKTRPAAPGKKEKKERAPVPLPDGGAIEQANASDALFTVRYLSEVLPDGASVHNSICGTSTAAAVVLLLLLSYLNWYMPLPWALGYADVSLISYVASVVCLCICRTRVDLAAPHAVRFLQCNTVQWYPGHIAKAERQLKEQLKMVDLVLEVRDARIPFSTCHPQVGWGSPPVAVGGHPT